jgi:hypothetical protein
MIRTVSLTKTNGDGALALMAAEFALHPAGQRMSAWGAVLDPADVQGCVLKPAQVHDLGRSQALPEGQEDISASRPPWRLPFATATSARLGRGPSRKAPVLQRARPSLGGGAP